MILSTDRMKKNAINRDSAKAKTVWKYVDNFTIKSLFSNFLSWKLFILLEISYNQ